MINLQLNRYYCAKSQVIGALYQDGGLPAASQFVTRQWQDEFHNSHVPPPSIAKSKLQEWCQQRPGNPLPHYSVVRSRDGAGQPEVFAATVCLPGVAATGSGRHTSAKEAKKLAAADMLAKVWLLD